MAETKCYINGIGIISPQKTFDNDQFLTELITYEKNILTSVTPDFKAFISPVHLRRLSRMLRIGMTAAIICMKDARVEIPDGIITATGYGFLEETEKFLRELLDRDEKQLTPTYFMQGTYNALAGLVALSVKCTGYNSTYVSKGFAFENALHDALSHLSQNNAQNFLVGCYDEAASVQYIAGLREKQFKKESVINTKLFDVSSEGSIHGEGSAFFDLSGTAGSSTWCELKAVQLVYRPESAEELHEDLMAFLQKNNTRIADIDILISGLSGDSLRDGILTDLEQKQLKNMPRIYFKHLCGEYCTSASFGFWLGAGILRHQRVPEVVKVSNTSSPRRLGTILIVNSYLGRNYSFFLLTRHR